MDLERQAENIPLRGYLNRLASVYMHRNINIHMFSGELGMKFSSVTSNVVVTGFL